MNFHVFRRKIDPRKFHMALRTPYIRRSYGLEEGLPMSTAVEERTETTTGLTKYTINLVRRAVRALEIAIEVTGDNRTDTFNRAIQVYAYIAKAEAEGKSLYIEGADGSREKLLLT
uniref:hypothetical protein n=1 Tax=Actinoplanes sp. CA-151224 TaxID=3239904 RepID=UPI003F4989A2